MKMIVIFITHYIRENNIMGKIYEGSYTSNCVANIKGKKIYRGSYTSECIGNTYGGMMSAVAGAAYICLL